MDFSKQKRYVCKLRVKFYIYKNRHSANQLPFSDEKAFSVEGVIQNLKVKPSYTKFTRSEGSDTDDRKSHTPTAEIKQIIISEREIRNRVTNLRARPYTAAEPPRMSVLSQTATETGKLVHQTGSCRTPGTDHESR